MQIKTAKGTHYSLCRFSYNQYALGERNKMIHHKKAKNSLIISVLFIVLVLTATASVLIGKFDISVKECLGIIVSKLVPIKAFWTPVQDNMVSIVRIPRIIIALLVGMALSVAGTSYQCIFRNPMAAPDILGASTGAAFGAALAILLGLGNTYIMVFAFISGLVCVAMVMLCGRIARGNPIFSLVLSGIMIGSLFSAATSYLKLIADPNDTLPAITYWLMGSFSGVSAKQLSYIWLPILIGAVPIFALRWKMNLLTLEDDEARAIGVNTKLIRTVVIISATLLTAASVAVSGIIGWIGLVIPHMARKLVGNDCRGLVPASALMGGIFLILVDDLARNLYTTELPLGVLTAFIGAPFFIFLLSRKGDW
ncbi:MAG: iron ABC transporter permease [Oscillospiraceae bacterium]|nr:iron ABC transporter permease [Oscillospiraceae bacterium]